MKTPSSESLSLKALCHLSMAAAISLLAACGGGGSGGASSAYYLPYLTFTEGTKSLHLVNTSTRASSKQVVSEAGAYFPWQLVPGDADKRLMAMPASHVFYYDDAGHGYRRTLQGNGGAFAFAPDCTMVSWSFGDQMPAIPWAVADCGASGLKLMNLLATSGNGVVSDADLTDITDMTLLAATWDDNGPSGFIAAQRRTAGEYALYRYSSTDFAHPQQIGTIAAAKGFRRLGLGDLYNRNVRVGASDTLWLEADNGLAGKTYYRVSMGRYIVIVAPAGFDLSGVSRFVAQGDALYYAKTVGGVASFYKLSGIFNEQKLIDITEGSARLWGFTPTRMLYQDGPNLRSVLLDGTGGLKSIISSSTGYISSLYMRDETIYFTMATPPSVLSGRIRSDGNASFLLGNTALFRADFAGVNSGTPQDDDRLYQARTNYDSSDITVSLIPWSDPESPIDLGIASGYRTATCTNDRLDLRLAHTAASDGNQLMTLDCWRFVGDGGVFSLKPGQADSLKPLQSVAPHSTRTQTLLPLIPS